MSEYADQRSHDIMWMTAQEREAWEALTSGSHELLGSHITDRDYHESVSIRT